VSPQPTGPETSSSESTGPEPTGPVHIRRAYEGQVEVGGPDWVYVPIEVPPGVDEIAVSYSYDRREPTGTGNPGNALDIGIFDERGYELGSASGFRGWSGGARDSFRISSSAATPGYLPGLVNPGTWHVLLGPYTVAPEGLSYRVEVTMRGGSPGPAFVSTPAPERATGRGRAWYRGDLHLHTVHSDGQLRPEELVAAARDAGLDFVASTEHNTSSAAGIWGRHATDDLLIIDGEEVTTRNGHLVVAGLESGRWIDWRYRAVDDVLPQVLHEIHRQGAIAIAAHPFAPCVACAWKFGVEGLDAMEVWNGPWTPDDEMSLRHWDSALASTGAQGSWLPAVGSSDFHDDTEGDRVGLGQTVVLAEDLTRDAILAGIRAGSSYLTSSSEVELTMRATGAGRTAGIGERLVLPAHAPVTVELSVRGVPAGTARFVTDQGQLAQMPLPPGGHDTLRWTTTAAAATYVRAEVRLPPNAPMPFEPMAALTNPIFLDAEEQAVTRD
jgi:hypothetical protein